nr:CoA ester lyase [Sphingomonas colocasiae]
MFVPANRADFIAKLDRAPADAVAIDLEDGLAPVARPETRARLDEIVHSARARAAAGTAVWVRVNAADTPDFGADCAAAADCGCDGIILAKAESGEEVERAATLTGRPVLAGIESVAGLFAASEIAHAAQLGVFFGAEDYVVDLGGRRTAQGLEVLYARSQVALAARRARVPALDLVTIDMRDDARCDADAEAGRDLGYTGKMCITPRQVERANAAYRPAPEAVEQAARLIAAYEAAKARGLGAIAFEGRMVDEPLLRQARAIAGAAT